MQRQTDASLVFGVYIHPLNSAIHKLAPIVVIPLWLVKAGEFLIYASRIYRRPQEWCRLWCENWNFIWQRAWLILFSSAAAAFQYWGLYVRIYIRSRDWFDFRLLGIFSLNTATSNGNCFFFSTLKCTWEWVKPQLKISRVFHCNLICDKPQEWDNSFFRWVFFFEISDVYVVEVTL